MPQTDRNRPLYMISVAADLAGLHPQTLRIYESKGLVTPQRTSGNTRMYSQADVERLELITRLTDEGINLAGVVRILDMKERTALPLGYGAIKMYINILTHILNYFNPLLPILFIFIVFFLLS